ncbi:MAG: biotin--[acetyl-CoA-carboxylase] ligase [Bacteroidetes bacterium]|nr:biotin--[acetyl-CoA-carboxylase] ligase [Bacteroidota bacterium]
MKTLFTGQYCIKLDKTDSTNSHLIELLATDNLPEGAVVITKKQERGRGQRGTNWESESGKNLTLSILLKPTFLKPDEQFVLSKAIAVAVADFIISLIPRPLSLASVKIKWPNDIYIGNKKVAGILIENSVSGNSLCHSIIGIGINVNQEKFSAELLNPTSMKLETGKEFHLEECFEQLCSCIEKRYLQLRNHSKEIDSDYLKNIYRFDEWANYNYKGEIIKARIIGVSKIGKLVLEREGGEVLECDVKEISFL